MQGRNSSAIILCFEPKDSFLYGLQKSVQGIMPLKENVLDLKVSASISRLGITY